MKERRKERRKDVVGGAGTCDGSVGGASDSDVARGGERGGAEGGDGDQAKSAFWFFLKVL